MKYRNTPGRMTLATPRGVQQRVERAGCPWGYKTDTSEAQLLAQPLSLDHIAIKRLYD
jgi:hypothetical protein